MRSIILPALCLLTFGGTAQMSRSMYAVTGNQPGDIIWTKVRKVNAELPVLLDGQTKGNFVMAQSGEKVMPRLENLRAPDELPAPNGIAALAYDRDHNRLYFAPMFREGGIRFIDLDDKTANPTVHIYSNAYNLIDRQKDGEGPNITRMVIGKNNIGYAISNDGYSFIRFSTVKTGGVENLGSLVDAEANGASSVHNKCGGWGGDIVAAETGELYLFTMQQQVFRIDPETRVTTLLGRLKGLDPSFSVNGAAVDEEGRVVLSSSVQPGIKGVVADITTLEASTEKDEKWMNASDLATSNLLFANKLTAEKWALPAKRTPGTEAVSIFPNPVDNGFFLVAFDNLPKGRYTIDLLNGAGNNTMRQAVQVQEKGQTFRVNTASFAKGLYVMRIINADRKEVYTQKVILQ